jgi:hypothetical protein
MKNSYIFPGEEEQMEYWTKRLGVTRAQLNEAILETGSLNVIVIKNYLKKKKFPFSFSGIRSFIKLTI